MAWVQMPNGEFGYFSGGFQYSKEHGAYYCNQTEETELVNQIVD
jgi:hypothetical protein